MEEQLTYTGPTQWTCAPNEFGGSGRHLGGYNYCIEYISQFLSLLDGMWYGTIVFNSVFAFLLNAIAIFHQRYG